MLGALFNAKLNTGGSLGFSAQSTFYYDASTVGFETANQTTLLQDIAHSIRRFTNSSIFCGSQAVNALCPIQTALRASLFAINQTIGNFTVHIIRIATSTSENPPAFSLIPVVTSENRADLNFYVSKQTSQTNYRQWSNSRKENITSHYTQILHREAWALACHHWPEQKITTENYKFIDAEEIYRNL